MTVVCAGQQVNRIDLGSEDVGLVAAHCCCTACLATGCLGVHFVVGLNFDVPRSEIVCGVFE